METLWIKFPRFHYLPTIIYIHFPKKSHDFCAQCGISTYYYNKSPWSNVVVSSSSNLSCIDLS